jgi:prevent-host-death family protein
MTATNYKQTKRNTWTVTEARRGFSALLRAAELKGPQFITRRGRLVAVMISEEEWPRLQPA